MEMCEQLFKLYYKILGLLFCGHRVERRRVPQNNDVIMGSRALGIVKKCLRTTITKHADQLN